MAAKNGRVTIARLDEKMDMLIEGFKAVDSKVDKLMEERAANRERFKKLDGLEGRINKMGSAGIIGAIIAGFLGIFLNPNK